MKRNYKLIFGLFFSITFSLHAQSKYKNIGDRAYEKKLYEDAATYYSIYIQSGQKPMDVSKEYGISLYHLNRVAEAIKYLNLYYIEKPNDLEVIHYLGKCAHHTQKFDEAIQFYKYYLSKVKWGSQNYLSLVADIKRCSEGRRLLHKEPIAIVENLGKLVNSKGDEVDPKWSPNYSDRIYFSSNQSLDSTLENDGLNKTVLFNTDLLGTELYKGVWLRPYYLNPQLNSGFNEVLQGFTSNGKIAIYAVNQTLEPTFQYYADTLGKTSNKDSKKIDNWPLKNDKFARDFYFFNDSIFLFSSIREDGFGGYDIYIMKKLNHVWTEPENLGSKVNTEFDERSPFLSNDGRTMYFSNNGLASIGGFDIFKIIYDDKLMLWSEKVNLANPINSPGNDLGFILSKDGQICILSSDRKESLGGFDLYSGYFNAIRTEQTLKSIPGLFCDVPYYKSQSKEYDAELKRSMITNVALEEINYLNDDIFSNVKSKPYFDHMVELATKFPLLNFTFLIHTASSVAPEIDLFFGIKRLEKLSSYLVNKGIAPNRVVLQSVGNLYPMAKNELDNKPNISGQKLNCRIETYLSNTDSLPIALTTKKQVVSELLKTREGKDFDDLNKGLIYRIQIITLRQMYKGDLYSVCNDLMIESKAESKTYKYLCGLFPTYKKAVEFIQKLNELGITDAFVVAYIDHNLYTKPQINERLMIRYPDLRNYYLD